VYFGPALLTLDDKGRLSFPTRFREALTLQSAGRATLTRHHRDDCLLIYPQTVWDAKAAELQNLDYELQDVARALFGHMHPTELDSAGRLLIPATHRVLVGLERDVLLLGLGKYFELWDAKRHAEHLQARRGKEPSEAEKGFKYAPSI
jgi:MraZ protein